MDVNTTVTRAKSGLGKGTEYKSPGKMPKFASPTWPQNAKNDCSGFVYWSVRFPSNPPESRQVDHPFYKKINGGWFETTAIYADGNASVGYFTKLDNPVVGAMLVYPDYVGADGKSHDGHIGIITKVKANAKGIAGVSSVIHCSLGAWKSKHDAVQETDPSIWLNHKGSIIVWYDGYSDPHP